jgi:hypothetical protein
MKATLVFGLVVSLLATSLASKGATTKITIRDTVSGRSVDITDEAVLQDFNVWTGPGTFLGGVEGTTGFIIDWESGIVVQRPHGLRRYEVRFYVNRSSPVDEQPAYVVFYEHDAASQRGFVYLPGKSDEQYRLNTRAIFRGHGYEGSWFHANTAWKTAIRTLIPVP